MTAGDLAQRSNCSPPTTSFDPVCSDTWPTDFGKCFAPAVTTGPDGEGPRRGGALRHRGLDTLGDFPCPCRGRGGYSIPRFFSRASMSLKSDRSSSPPFAGAPPTFPAGAAPPAAGRSDPAGAPAPPDPAEAPPLVLTPTPRDRIIPETMYSTTANPVSATPAHTIGLKTRFTKMVKILLTNCETALNNPRRPAASGTSDQETPLNPAAAPLERHTKKEMRSPTSVSAPPSGNPAVINSEAMSSVSHSAPVSRIRLVP